MTTAGMMHWHEGLFLLPHHLQWMQRDLAGRVRTARSLLREHHYGVVDMRVVVDALGEYQLRFDRLHAIMPSGLEVVAGINADLGVRDFRQRFKELSGGMQVSLGVPLHQPTGANAVSLRSDPGLAGERTDEDVSDAARINRLYALKVETVLDENTGQNAQRVVTRRVNARIVLQGDDTRDLETLPLMRLEAAGTEDGIKPREDPTFLPPCFGIGGSPALMTLLRDLASAVATHRQEQAQRLGGPGVGFNPAALNSLQMVRVLRLRTLNAFAGSLPQLVAMPAASPFDVYLRLRELLGELAALAPDRDQFEALPYDHDRPGPVFRDLDRRIRPLLGERAVGTFKEFKFSADGQYLTSEPIDAAVLTSGTEFLLVIHSKMEPGELTQLVTNKERFKLGPLRIARMGGTINVPGIKLERTYSVPPELPQPRGSNYFSLIPTAEPRMWEMAKQDGRMCVVWDTFQKFDHERVSLIVMLPEAAAAR